MVLIVRVVSVRELWFNIILEQCIMRDNQGEDGTVYFRSHLAEGLIKQCIFYDNDDSQAVIYCQNSPIKVYNNTVIGNGGTTLKFIGQEPL